MSTETLIERIEKYLHIVVKLIGLLPVIIPVIKQIEDALSSVSENQ